MKKRRITIIFWISLLPVLLMGQFGDLDERGDYYLTMFGGYIDTTFGYFDYWNGFVRLNLDGDSLSYRDVRQFEESDSGKYRYSVDDSNRITVIENDSLVDKGIISQDGQFFQLASTEIYNFGLYTAIKTSTGLSNADLAGDYYAGVLENMYALIDKQIPYMSNSAIVEIKLEDDGTGFVYFPDEADSIALFYELKDNGHFIISGFIEESPDSGMVEIFDGVLSPDKEIIAMAWIDSDSTHPEYKENRMVIGAKKSSAMDIAALHGDYLYYEMYMGRDNVYGFTSINEISLDGSGSGTYRVLEQTGDDPLDSGTLTYSVMEDGAVEVSGTSENTPWNFTMNGFISKDSKIFVLAYADSGSDSTSINGSLFGVGVAKPTTPTKIKENNRNTVSRFSLSQNYPNPFNPATTIQFHIPVSGKVILQVYNIKGQVIRTLVNDRIFSGLHIVQWDGKNESGRFVSSGIYFYTLEFDNKYIYAKKMLLTK